MSTARPPSSPPPPPFLNSLTELRGLSTALSTFLHRYDDLQSHLDFIKTSIDSKLPQNQTLISSIPGSVNANDSEKSELGEKGAKSCAETSNSVEIDAKNPELEEPKGVIEIENPNLDELKTIVQSMNGKALRRYVSARMRISEADKLRTEVPNALKLAEDPAKLVLSGIGRFYIQGSRAFAKARNNDSKIHWARESCLLLMECLLSMEEKVVVKKEVRNEAVRGAKAWRDRILSEGGLSIADEADLRGLLLYVSCFGIPMEFRNEDLRELVKASSVKLIAGALKRSTVLIPRLPALIEWMLNKMEVDAIDIVYTFGLEDRYPPQTILTNLWEKRTRSKEENPFAAKEVNMQLLRDLKSVKKIFSAHKINPSRDLPEFKIHDKINTLEQKIGEVDKKIEEIIPKRKFGETGESKKLNAQDVKRSCLNDHNNSAPHQHKAPVRADTRSPYSRLAQPNSFPGGSLSGNYHDMYSASSSVLHGSGLPEIISGSYVASAGLPTGLYDGDRRRTAVGPVGPMVDGTSRLLTSSYPGIHSRMAVDTIGPMADPGSSLRYGFPGNVSFGERLGSDTLFSRAYTSEPHGTSASSLESFMRMSQLPPSAGSLGRGSASGLYKFADSIS